LDRPDARQPVGRLRLFIATAGGVGYFPVASGTAGSVPGVLLAWGLWELGGLVATIAGVVVATLVGVWAAHGAERHFGKEDPGPVVIDEVAGQMLTLLFVQPTPLALGLGFFLFRLFDVLKPFPARRLESLPGGSGIMADDLAAGIYANVVLQIVLRLLPA
jgi:phosphatidylglycerophosphatase A